MAHMAFFSVGSAGAGRHSRSMSSREQRLMRELFHLADANKDGVVDYEEYARMFSGKGLSITKEEVRAVFDMMDKNRDM